MRTTRMEPNSVRLRQPAPDADPVAATRPVGTLPLGLREPTNIATVAISDKHITPGGPLHPQSDHC